MSNILNKLLLLKPFIEEDFPNGIDAPHCATDAYKTACRAYLEVLGEVEQLEAEVEQLEAKREENKKLQERLQVELRASNVLVHNKYPHTNYKSKPCPA